MQRQSRSYRNDSWWFLILYLDLWNRLIDQKDEHWAFHSVRCISQYFSNWLLFPTGWHRFVNCFFSSKSCSVMLVLIFLIHSIEVLFQYKFYLRIYHRIFQYFFIRTISIISTPIPKIILISYRFTETSFIWWTPNNSIRLINKYSLNSSNDFTSIKLWLEFSNY